MVLEYFTRKSKAPAQTAQSPVLTDEDEKFLERLTSEEAAPPLPDRPVTLFDNGSKPVGKCAQTALMDGADKIALPQSPPPEDLAGVGDKGKGKADLSASEQKSRNYWAFLPTMQMPNVQMPTVQMPNVQMPSFSLHSSKGKSKAQAGADLSSAVAVMRTSDGQTISEAEKQSEQNELTAILDQLNLGAVNNRAFSFSVESQKLMHDFTQVLKDIVNGVPTAYDDLEKLLTNSDKQLRKTFGDLPPFMQTFVKALPAKLTGTMIAPELLAATAAKPGLDVKSAGPSSFVKKKMRVPSLKSLVSAEGAVAGMLRSILNFLKLRFPAFVTGTNILMSLAVFLLLFVFWYCHKRGREVRLEGERLAAGASAEASSEEASDMEDSIFKDRPGDEEERKRLEEILNRTDDAKNVPSPK